MKFQHEMRFHRHDTMLLSIHVVITGAVVCLWLQVNVYDSRCGWIGVCL